MNRLHPALFGVTLLLAACTTQDISQAPAQGAPGAGVARLREAAVAANLLQDAFPAREPKASFLEAFPAPSMAPALRGGRAGGRGGLRPDLAFPDPEAGASGSEHSEGDATLTFADTAFPSPDRGGTAAGQPKGSPRVLRTEDLRQPLAEGPAGYECELVTDRGLCREKLGYDCRGICFRGGDVGEPKLFDCARANEDIELVQVICWY